MADMNCTNPDKYTRNNGKCCDRCAAGQYVEAECDHKRDTKCTACGPGSYMATKNYLNRCHRCLDCNASNNKKTIKDCTAQEDRVCGCVTGFYCSNDLCDHCLPDKLCSLGEGVKVRATRTNATVCARCEDGTYSNVTDFVSPCHTHTRCDDLGRVLKTPGTPTTDAICGDFKSHCNWIIPTGLWLGLVLTALVLFGVICWRAKRKSYKAEKKEAIKFLQPLFKTLEAGSSVPVTVVEMVPAVTHPEVSLPVTVRNGHCQEETCKFPHFKAGYHAVECDTQDSVDSSPPTTPLKASVSLDGSSKTNCSSDFLRTYSEPQEDEWCGTMIK